MNDDALLEALGQVAIAERDADPLDPRWDALAADALSPEDRAALEALAADDPTFEGALDAFAPRSAAFDAAIADRIVQAVRPPAPVLRPKRPWRRWLWAAAPLAAAAAIVLFWSTRAGEGALPAYALDASSGEKAMRGEAVGGGLPIYGPGSTLDLVLRPAQDVSVPVAARVFHRAGERIEASEVQLSATASGSFRLVGPVDAVLPARAGPAALIFAIGPPDALPDSVDAVRQALLNPPHRWQLFEYPYERRLSR